MIVRSTPSTGRSIGTWTPTRTGTAPKTTSRSPASTSPTHTSCTRTSTTTIATTSIRTFTPTRSTCAATGSTTTATRATPSALDPECGSVRGSRLRDPAEDRVRIAILGEIAQADDPHRLAAVDHRDPPDRVLPHEVHRRVDGVG